MVQQPVSHAGMENMEHLKALHHQTNVHNVLQARTVNDLRHLRSLHVSHVPRAHVLKPEVRHLLTPVSPAMPTPTALPDLRRASCVRQTLSLKKARPPQKRARALRAIPVLRPEGFVLILPKDVRLDRTSKAVIQQEPSIALRAQSESFLMLLVQTAPAHVFHVQQGNTATWQEQGLVQIARRELFNQAQAQRVVIRVVPARFLTNRRRLFAPCATRAFSVSQNQAPLVHTVLQEHTRSHAGRILRSSVYRVRRANHRS